MLRYSNSLGSFSLRKVPFRGLTEKKCQKQSFHFSLPQHADCGSHRSLSPWDVQKLQPLAGGSTGGISVLLLSTGRAAPGLWPAQLGQSLRGKKRLSQQTVGELICTRATYFPHPCSVSIENIWFALSLERNDLCNNSNGFFKISFCSVLLI